MPIYALGDVEPTIHPEAFIHPDAVIIGDVHIGAQSSVWPSAVLRGDNGPIRIGDRSSIQDGSVLHVTEDLATTVADDCTIGHLVHLEGCTIESGALVGNASIVLHRARVCTGALVASNAVVLNNMIVPAGALALGVPAKIREGAADAEQIRSSAEKYVAKVKRYKAELRLLD